MKIWVVEDERALGEGLQVAFSRRGYETEWVSSLGGLKGLLSRGAPEIVFLDVRLQDGDGLKALPHILHASQEARIIVMTAFGDSALVVRAIREGAFNYLDKPFPLEAAAGMAQRAEEAISLSRRVSRMEDSLAVSPVGTSGAMQGLRDFVQKVSRHENVNILIRGESGTGKEVVARMIHGASESSGEFVAINCAAIPENLLEAELFGFRKGAYTGASMDKRGLVEVAHGGTLFLDEIGDMPMSLQSKLLRFLDSRSLRPLGASREVQVSLRVICATCVNLEEKIAMGAFRQDLFYRIAMLPLEIPPLRDRDRDSLELLRHFIVLYSKRLGRPPLHPSPDVEEVFQSYAWPGNVRELKNIVERLFILKDPDNREISLKDLPQEMLEAMPSDEIYGGSKGTAGDMSLQDELDKLEKHLLKEALAKAGGSRTQGAAMLGLSRYAFLRRLQKHDMD